LKAYNIPHEALLLRWTSAIKEKAEKLIGTRLNPTVGYLQKRYVGESDAYVIAINGRLLRAGWPQLEGISQWPLAVEATFSVGPYALTLDRESLQVVDRGHQHRPVVPKPNGALVPADTFLDPRFAPISAVWAMDFDELSIIGRPQPMAVVHNPAARNPLPPNLLPAFAEYVATIENRYYNLERRSGRLGDISEV
jgi:type I restriction enzyme S subunit